MLHNHQAITRLRTILYKSAIFQYRGSRFLLLFLSAVARMFFPFSDIVVIPTPYGRFMTTKRSVRVLTSIFDFVETQVQDFFHKNIVNARVFIDVGSYHGWYTLKASRMMEGKHVILDFEPNRTNFNILLKNIQLNRLSGVFPFNIALSDGDEHLKLGDEVVRCVRLDSVLSSLGIEVDRVGLIKIDVEGMAMEVLRGAMDILSKSKPALIIELHGAREQDAIELLKGLGYTVKVVPRFGLVAKNGEDSLDLTT